MTLQALIIHSTNEGDIKLAKRLGSHLSSLRRAGIIAFDMAELYEDSAADIRPSAEAADLIVVILSANLVCEDASCETVRRIIARHRAGEVRAMLLVARALHMGDEFKGVTRFPRDKSILEKAGGECEECGHRSQDGEGLDGLLVEFCGNIEKTAKEIVKLRGE